MKGTEELVWFRQRSQWTLLIFAGAVIYARITKPGQTLLVYVPDIIWIDLQAARMVQEL